MSDQESKAEWGKVAVFMSLVWYLLIVGLGAVVVVIANFPSVDQQGAVVFPRTADGLSQFFPFRGTVSPDQGLLLLALFAGISGSFLHAAQSLSSYIGNAAFKVSWTAWYFLRPWVGGVLGFALYFALRSGLVSGINAVNPYGVVALGLLGGWFSKTTTDKLQEVFETLFKTDEDAKRKDKLHSVERPVINGVTPSPVPTSATELTISGRHFMAGTKVRIGDVELDGVFVSETELKAPLSKLVNRPSGNAKVTLQIRNPEGLEPLSTKQEVTFD